MFFHQIFVCFCCCNTGSVQRYKLTSVDTSVIHYATSWTHDKLINEVSLLVFSQVFQYLNSEALKALDFSRAHFMFTKI